MIHISAEQKVNEKHIIFMYDSMSEENAFNVTHILLFIKLGPMEYFCYKVCFIDAPVYNCFKQAVVSASDNIETAHPDVRVFIQQTQCYAFIWHFDYV